MRGLHDCLSLGAQMALALSVAAGVLCMMALQFILGKPLMKWLDEPSRYWQKLAAVYILALAFFLILLAVPGTILGLFNNGEVPRPRGGPIPLREYLENALRFANYAGIAALTIRLLHDGFKLHVLMKSNLRSGIKELALLVLLLTGAGLFLDAFFGRDTFPYALAFGCTLLIWFKLDLHDRQRKRERMILSVLEIPVAQLHAWGLTDDLIDRLLGNTALRTEYLRAIEQHVFHLEEVLRADMSAKEIEEGLAQARVDLARDG